MSQKKVLTPSSDRVLRSQARSSSYSSDSLHSSSKMNISYREPEPTTDEESSSDSEHIIKELDRENSPAPSNKSNKSTISTKSNRSFRESTPLPSSTTTSTTEKFKTTPSPPKPSFRPQPSPPPSSSTSSNIKPKKFKKILSIIALLLIPASAFVIHHNGYSDSIYEFIQNSEFNFSDISNYFNILELSASTSTPPGPKVSKWTIIQKKFLKAMKADAFLKKQEKHTFISLLSALNSTMSELVPTQPSCIFLMAHPSTDPKFPLCFARKIGRLATIAMNEGRPVESLDVEIEEIDKTYFSSENITQIYGDLKTYLKERGKVVIVKNVEEIQEEQHLLLFHSFCDNTLAPEKRATFIFISTVPEKITQNLEWTAVNSGTISQKILDAGWVNAISDDKRPALIARITGTVALLKKGENSCSL